MSYTGIEPEGVRVLADQLTASADLAEGLALDVDRALFDSGLDSSTPSVLRGFAIGLVHTGAVLRSRAELAQGFVLDFALHSALLSVARSVVVAAPACVVGPSTTLGSSSPCDPVESIKVYSLAAGAYIPFTGVAGLKLDASYVLRVETLRSGRLRVTRIDEADVWIATSVGLDRRGECREVDDDLGSVGEGVGTAATGSRDDLRDRAIRPRRVHRERYPRSRRSPVRSARWHLRVWPRQEHHEENRRCRRSPAIVEAARCDLRVAQAAELEPTRTAEHVHRSGVDGGDHWRFWPGVHGTGRR